MKLLLRRLLRLGTLALLVVILLLGAAWLLREPLFGDWLRGRIEQELTTALGGRYRVGRLGGTWLTNLEVHGLETLEASPDGAITLLAFERLDVALDPFELLGDGPIAMVRSVRLAGGRLEVDLDRPQPDDDAPAESPLDLLPRVLPRLDLQLDVGVRTGGETLRVRGMEVTALDGRTIRLQATDLALPARFGGGGALAGRIDWEPRERLRWRSDTPLSGLVLAEASYARGDRLAARLLLAGGRLRVSLDEGVAHAEGRSLAWERLPPWVHGLLPDDVTLPARGSFGFDLDAEALAPLAVRARLEGSNWTWADHRIEYLQVAATHSDDATVVELLQITADAGRVDARDVRLEPERPYLVGRVGALDLDVPDLARFIGDLPRPVAVRVRARTDDAATLHIDSFEAKSGASVLRAHGRATLPADPAAWRETALALALDARLEDLSLPDFELTGRVDVKGRAGGTLRTPEGSLTVQGNNFSAQGRAVAQLAAEVDLAWPRLAVRTLRVQSAPGRVSGEADLGLEPFAVERAQLDLDVPDVAGFLALLPATLPAVSGGVRGTVRGSWRGGRPAGQAEVRVRNLVVEGTRIGDVELDVTAADGRVRASRIVADTPWAKGTLSANVDLDGETARIETLDVRVDGHAVQAAAPFDVAWAGGVFEARDVNLRAAGGTVAGRVRLGTFIEGRVALRDVDLAALPVALPIGGRVSGVVERSADLLRVELESEALAFRDRRASLKLVLTQDAGSLVLERLRLDGGATLSLEGSGSLPWRVEGESLVRQPAAPDLRIKGSLASVAELTELDVSQLLFELRGTHTGLVLDLEAARVRAKTGAPLEGRVRARAELAQDGTRVRAELNPVSGGRVGLDLRTSGGLTWDDVLAWQPYVDALADGTVEGRVDLTVPDLAPWARLLPDVVSVAGRLESGFAISGPIRDPHLRGSVSLDTVTGTLDKKLPSLRDAAVRLEADGRRVQIAELRGRVGNAPFRASGTVQFDEQLSRLIEGAQVDARVQAEIPDMNLLVRFLPDLRFLEGRGALDLRLRGRLLDPDIEGTLTLADLGGQITPSMPSITQGRARIRLAGRTLTVEELRGELGYAPFSLTGTLELPRGGAAGRADLRFEGRNVLLLRNRDLRVRADANLTVVGPLDALVARGRLQVTRALYSKTMNLFGGGARASARDERLQLFSIREGPLSTMRFDVAVEADDSIRIRNNVIRGAFSARLTLRGTGKVPEPGGRIWFRDTLVKLPYSSLKVDQGELNFPPDDPFDPRLQARARTRMKGYDLSVVVQGPLSDLSVQVSSVPALPQDDAVLLLTTGATRTQLEEEGLERAALTRVRSLVGERLLSKAGGPGDPDERSFFDRFTFVMGRDVSRSGQDTAEAEFEVAERWFLRAERDVHDDINAGVVWRVRFR